MWSTESEPPYPLVDRLSNTTRAEIEVLHSEIDDQTRCRNDTWLHGEHLVLASLRMGAVNANAAGRKKRRWLAIRPTHQGRRQQLGWQSLLNCHLLGQYQAINHGAVMRKNFY